MTSDEQRELWRRWREGETLTAIGEILSLRPSSVFRLVRREGGYSPPERTRSVRALSLVDREEISRGLASGEAIRSIAVRLGRPASTVSREVARNGGSSRYRAGEADDAAWRRAKRPKDCLLKLRPRLRAAVARKLSKNWSPQQIAGWLRVAFGDDASMQVSHETIYKSLFVQARGVLKKELQAHLRTRRRMRKSRQATTKGKGRGGIKDLISIRERPAEAEDRAVPGHWEGDLICGSNNSYILTLVERTSRFTMLAKVDSKETQTVVKALARRIRRLPPELKRSVTWDRGSEMAGHATFTVEAKVPVYFCDPQSPWQRGTNENTNALLRQYFPKGTNLSVHTQAHLNRVANELNTRPRQTLGFRTPAYILNESVAMTG